jgi:outer membrane protein assembly factor BamB
LVCFLHLLPVQLPAEDWPCFHGDAKRSGISRETLAQPLHLAWSFQAAHPPTPAFKGMLAEYKSKTLTRREAITYDYAFHPVSAGEQVLFASSTEEAVFCLDAKSGRQQWVFYAQGPVRLAPVLDQGKVYVGADDGYVYCLEAGTGNLVWKHQAAPEKRLCVGNQHVISQWPVRTGVVLADGILYFAAGVLPPQGVFLQAVAADNGRLLWKQQVPYAPNGQMLVTGESLWMPTGRTAPAEFSRKDGTPKVGQPELRRAQGGSFVGIFDDTIFYGPCESGMLHLRVGDIDPNLKTRKAGAGSTGLIALLKGRCLLADADWVYLLREEKILALGKATLQAAIKHAAETALKLAKFREPSMAAAGLLLKEDTALFEELQASARWSTNGVEPYSWAILAGTSLFAGARGSVTAIDCHTGKQTWTGAVEGEVLGLAVANGALYASSDAGRIYCFRSSIETKPMAHIPAINNPFPNNSLLADAAETAIQSAGRSKGYCLVIGVGTGQLAAEIVRRSEFYVVACDRDLARVQVARQNLAAAGLYGKRVVVHHVPHELEYPDFFANLIVSESVLDTGTLPWNPTPKLQPYGGTIVLGNPQGQLNTSLWPGSQLSAWQTLKGKSDVSWLIARRGALPGAGEWSHGNADPANTVCSQESRVGRDLGLQWFGLPGANDVVDRHDIAHAPLVKNGILFNAGLHNTLSGIDCYNGTALWKIQTAGSTRKIISHQAPFMAAGENAVFIASGKECWLLEPLTGKKIHAFTGMNPEDDWGYVGTVRNLLIGSNQRAEVSRRALGRIGDFTQADARLSKPAVSENLFAYDYLNRQPTWKYVGGKILNPSITLGGGLVFLAESRNPAIMSNQTGMAAMTEFTTRDAFLVALDLATGQERWRQALLPKTTEPHWILYLGYAGKVLLVTRVYWVNNHFSYDLTARDAGSGKELWTDVVSSPVEGPYAPLANGKNAQATRPCIVNGKVYWLAHTFGTVFCHDLLTGKTSHDTRFGRGWENKGCAPFVGSATALFHRATSCQMYDLATREKQDLTQVTRPGCWMSIIPAGGLILMPDAAAGCTCGLAMEMSLALAPK